MRHLLLPFLLHSQTGRSVKPFPASLTLKAGAAYATVIGISDYQGPDVPDLRLFWNGHLEIRQDLLPGSKQRLSS